MDAVRRPPRAARRVSTGYRPRRRRGPRAARRAGPLSRRSSRCAFGSRATSRVGWASSPRAINQLERESTELVQQIAPQLLTEPGFGRWRRPSSSATSPAPSASTPARRRPPSTHQISRDRRDRRTVARRTRWYRSSRKAALSLAQAFAHPSVRLTHVSSLVCAASGAPKRRLDGSCTRVVLLGELAYERQIPHPECGWIDAASLVA
jgi:hypothetical protein